ncbi:Cerato-ulmin hydrophobin family [Cercophora scortea]|uniref:Cerato-ulmin hydrophobin family n=1 Tax=Cercophora scortea TaxID=314031 RepID=A0AAE0IUK7_9PEZI|nr:Cerato-ulmin hydrophobin family [Cercophora scortea]
MQFTIATILAVLTASVAALPAQIEDRQVPYIPCSGLYATAQCCATDVLGVADLDCGNPSAAPASADDFSKVCSAIGQRARCCVLPLLDQGILCETPAGVVG